MTTKNRWAAWLLVLSCLVAGSGCKSMTTEQERAQEEIVREEAEAAKAAEEANRKAQEELLKQKHAAELEVARIKRERQRGEEMQEAASLLSSGDPEGALAILEPMIQENGKVEIETMQTFDEKPAYTNEWNDKQRGFGHLIAGISNFQLASYESPVDVDRQRAAAAMLEIAVESDSDSRDARENLAKIYFSLQDYPNALATLKKDFQAGYRSTDLLYLAAQARYFLAQDRAKVTGKVDKTLLLSARQAIEEAFVADPARADLRQWRLLLAKELGEWETALREVDAILSASPFDDEYMNEKLNLLLSLERYDDAIDHLEQWNRFQPLPGREARFLGDLYAQVGLHQRAADWYVKGYGDRLQDVNPEDFYRVGSSLVRAGSTERGKQWLEEIPQNAVIYPDALLELAYLAESMRDREGAIGYYQSHLAAKPDNFAAWYSVGELLRAKGDIEDAEAAYVKASSHDETAARGFVGLAECAYERGQLDEAISKYKEAVKFAPDAKHYQRALQEITQEKVVRDQSKAAAETDTGL